MLTKSFALKRYVLPSLILSIGFLTSPSIQLENHSDHSFSVSFELVQSAHARKSKRSYSRHYSSRRSHSRSSESHKKIKAPIYIAPEIEIIGMKSPSTEQQRQTIYSEAQIKYTYPNGETKVNPLVYQNLITMGQKINSLVAGGLYDVKGNTFTDSSDHQNAVDMFSNMPSGTSLFFYPSMKKTEKGGYPLYLVNQYYDISYNNKNEDIHSTYPMSLSMSLVNQNLNLPNASLSVQNYRNVDVQDIRGLWRPMGSSQTPWFTHLSSEHQEPDAKLVEKNQLQLTSMMNYIGKNYTPKVYHYGYTPEMMIALDGTHKVVKHYTLGRFSHHTAKVMPDRKTVYLTDDTAYGGFFMFVADKPRDLSAGTLYGAKWVQVSNQNNGTARLSWIPLGHATSKEIEELANSLKFSQIFSEVDENQAKQLPTGFTQVKSNNKTEWLHLNPNMEKAGAFLETRRYAGLMGATTEFSHLKGIALNIKDKLLYIAMSKIDDGMLVNKNDPIDDIQMNKISSGGIYELSLSRNIADSKNQRINSDYVATTMRGFLLGEQLDGTTTNQEDKIINPQFIHYSDAFQTLFIGESNTNSNANLSVWAYHTNHKKLARILSLPQGVSTGAVNFLEQYNTHNYLLLSTQQANRRKNNITVQSEIGYLLGFPTMMPYHANK